jgi:PAT family beta-lactamase induction signal transducer AmpG
LRYGVFFYLYLMQGIPAGFYTTALTNYFTAEGVRPKDVGAFVAVIGLPWAFQFIWGPLIDRFQTSPMGRRKPWVVGSQLMTVLASCVLLWVDDPVAQISTLGWLFCLRSVFAAIQDASVDAMAITVIPDGERGRVNAFMRAGFLIGMGIGAVVFALLLRRYGFHGAALVQIGCLLTGVLLMIFVREQPQDRLLPSFVSINIPKTAGTFATTRTDRQSLPEHDFRWLFTELFRGIFARQSLLLFGAILLVYISTSLFTRAYNHHLIDVIGWHDEEVSVLTGTYGMVMAAVVALTGGYLADRLGARRLLVVVMGLVTIYLLGFNTASSTWIQREVSQAGLVALYFMDPAISAAAMPVLMSICRPGVEGSQFTTYMAFVNLCDIAGTFVAGNALEYVPAPSIGLLAGGLASVALLIVFFVIRHYRRVN